MLEFLTDQLLRVVRMRDSVVFVGKTTSVDGQKVRIAFFGSTDLKIGDEVKFSTGGDRGFANLFGAVIGLEDNQADLWISIEEVVPGLDRAPRTVAPGTTAILVSEQQELNASVCDISASGMRVRTLGMMDVGELVDVHINSLKSGISLQCRIARVIQDDRSDTSELGIQIVGADNLNCARYNHFVESLLRKATQAA